MDYKKILIAIDSSQFSMNTAKKGLELAHQLDAEVALLTIVDSSKAIGNVDAGISPEEALIVLRKEAEQMLDALASIYNGNKLVKLIFEGHPQKDIISTAEIWKADIIVMGTHGRTGLAHILVGSVAEYVVRHSTIPVIVVPAKKE